MDAGTKVKTVALSTEAAYMGFSEFIKELVWIRRLLKNIGAKQHGPAVIYEDNQGVMASANSVGYEGSK
ncbi:Retroelement Polyprotein [Phytophthora palmivora]|uniref:Retroelement Polyprotein n=1 Tax=Phytophthora palmivora TaxID=4796 RepID=A0A2P4XST3_9STRA|nr:Retroelement Polyprotein [Phytophthora palmivora]